MLQIIRKFKRLFLKSHVRNTWSNLIHEYNRIAYKIHKIRYSLLKDNREFQDEQLLRGELYQLRRTEYSLMSSIKKIERFAKIKKIELYGKD